MIFTDDEHQGVMDFKGNEIIRPHYDDIVYASANNFYAKPDKDNTDYLLINEKEKQIGKNDYMNVLPLDNGNAIVQESNDNWIFIDDNGEDLKIKQDIYRISNATMGNTELQNEFFDFNNIVSSLNFTKEGMLGMTINMDAQRIAAAIEALGQGDDDAESEVYPQYYITKSVASTAMAKNNIAMNVSATFDETMATMAVDSSFVFKAIKPNQIGLDIPATVVLSGKSKQLVNAIINNIKVLGQVVKENENAAIVNVGEASYFVANSGSHVYVVYGLLDVNKIDLDQYTNIKETVAEPIKSAAEEFGKVFKEIITSILSESSVEKPNEALVDTPVSNSNDIDKFLEAYNEYVDNYIAFFQKADKGDESALSESQALIEKAQKLYSTLDGAKNDMSSSQLDRYMEITNKMNKIITDLR